jgi:hypothetical protein
MVLYFMISNICGVDCPKHRKDAGRYEQFNCCQIPASPFIVINSQSATGLIGNITNCVRFAYNSGLHQLNRFGIFSKQLFN